MENDLCLSYEAPVVEILEVEVEKGFWGSDPGIENEYVGGDSEGFFPVVG